MAAITGPGGPSVAAVTGPGPYTAAISGPSGPVIGGTSFRVTVLFQGSEFALECVVYRTWRLGLCSIEVADVRVP